MIKTENDKNLHYLDTLNTVTTINGFVFNIIVWRDDLTNNKKYELRLGYVNDENITPVITLYDDDNYQNVLSYFQTIITKASDMYIFENKN